ncbi:MAG: branched-chain amino acid ABC transporter permease [Chloroflexi bacterium]|nr:branched-chain amino acid ABC transporter permease [Chloroflexota bacterium]
MTTFLQLILSGIMVGAIYSLVAIGVVLIFKSTGIFNIAQGAILMLGAYILFAFLVQLAWPLWIALIITFLLAIAAGYLIERFALRPLIGQSFLAAFMVTLAMIGLLEGLVTLVWGTFGRRYPEFIPTDPIRLGPLVLSQEYTWSFFIAAGLIVAFYFFFKYHRLGLAMRAVAEDHQAAQSTGISIKTAFSLSWVIGAVIATAGGILLATSAGVTISLGTVGLKALPVVLLGGLESIPGAIVGGLIIGIVEKVAGGYLDPMVGGGVEEVVPFVLMVIILLVKPYGLFGQVRIERI